jgi:hypothetical protein
MDTLDLVGSNDGVLQDGAVLEDEDGIGVTALCTRRSDPLSARFAQQERRLLEAARLTSS